MAVELGTPDEAGLAEVVEALRAWQRDDAPIQLHPGDLGWHWQFGARRTASALRTWKRDGQLLAIGFLDGPDVLRLTVAPEVWREQELARQVVADVSEPGVGVLPIGKASVEVPDGTRVQQLLTEVGWGDGESWTPLRCDLAGPVEPSGLDIEVVEPGGEAEFIAVHQSSWGSARFDAALWRTMASGLPFSDGRCLLGRDDKGHAVAGITVWSAGPGKPGLLEPMGVHAEHRGRGYGAAICRAAAAELATLGASSAMVCTPTANTGAVATYTAAGYRQLPQRLDRTRDA